ncbi:thioredoxin family protein [Pediococcus pentosaceus]|uniref:thioredoxin family protein n=1 Tax=Pediococcus pentosaceus TaxID=1255 RepID=UPI0018A13B88|nr:thioredoxin family protein [Pediococcus pentosaceus]MBF7129339.1 thioredoxin family protein [Pediococcus pentosaceus]MBF7132256.1 thioredoxin family protein [Pediococcus pentosaceus]
MKCLKAYLNIKKYKRIIKKSQNIIELDFSDLKKQLANPDKNFILIGRPTCAMCQQSIPYIEKATQKGKYDIYYFDTDKYEPNQYMKFFSSIGIKVLPSLLYLKGQNTFERMSVYRAENAIELWMNSVTGQ